MKNIERFNLYTAYLFARLYEEFPVHRAIVPNEVVAALNLPPVKPAEGHDAASTEVNFVVHAVTWLVDTDYLILRQRPKGMRYVLAPKAFEAMNAAVQQEDQEVKSVGEKLVEISREFGTELAKETQRQGVQN